MPKKKKAAEMTTKMAHHSVGLRCTRNLKKLMRGWKRYRKQFLNANKIPSTFNR